ncbi:MAG: tetratricopeptide repeat protein [Spirochaeta sp.]
MKTQNSLMLLLIGTAVVVSACESRDPLVERVARLEESGFSGQEIEDARIQELESEVSTYRDIVDEKVQANGQLMIYYRMLGIRYLDRQMYGPAMEALENALEITPANAQLHSYYAVAAAQTAKAKYDPAEQQSLFDIAEAAYSRALELNPNLSQALYGFAVLLVFELDRPDDALPHLDRLLERQRKHIDGRFVRAYAHAALGNVQEAIADYDAIIDLTPNTDVRREANQLRTQLMEGS